ncbi:hypothetical protein PVAND_002945 [Polypedilum vanderplanki]|uniref:Uncharacterized protein n=1 Tax=Polypedilum vanderplanki TaxID=319348 RepID=A0A9J6BT24_POLVA|nr:hypothetical protein PVAND_002945 [Polypedilum vanderplanki]
MSQPPEGLVWRSQFVEDNEEVEVYSRHLVVKPRVTMYCLTILQVRKMECADSAYCPGLFLILRSSFSYRYLVSDGALKREERHRRGPRQPYASRRKRFSKNRATIKAEDKQFKIFWCKI